MPKRKKRELQHLRQESARRRDYQLGKSTTSDYYKPGFPMNIFSNVRLFAIIGVVVIVSFVVAAILTNQLSSSAAPDVEVPTNTPSPTIDPSATVSPSTTATAKSWAQAEQVIDPAKSYTATMKTSKGDIVINLFDDQAPNTVNSFVFLAKQGYFDNMNIHRVLKDFVVQGGDPTGSGSGGPGYATQQEPNERRNARGTLSMAKVGNAKEFGSQFFINVKDNPSLDYDKDNPFFPFAEVTSGMDVVDAIANSPVQGQKPNPPIVINSVVIEEK